MLVFGYSNNDHKKKKTIFEHSLIGKRVVGLTLGTLARVSSNVIRLAAVLREPGARNEALADSRRCRDKRTIYATIPPHTNVLNQPPKPNISPQKQTYFYSVCFYCIIRYSQFRIHYFGSFFCFFLSYILTIFK